MRAFVTAHARGISRSMLPGAVAFVAASMLTLTMASPALADAPLSWSGPTVVDPGTSSSHPAITSVSCPTTTYCLAVDNAGNAISGDPLSAAAWTVTPVAGSALYSVSCVSPSSCYAVGGDSNLWATDAASQTGWTSKPGLGGLNAAGISCTAGFCAVISADAGSVMAGDPGQDILSTWKSSSTGIGGGNSGCSNCLPSISCASAQCYAVNQRGSASTGSNLASTQPKPSWQPASQVDSFNDLVGVSCGVLCVGVDLAGNVVSATGGGWTLASGSIDGNGFNGYGGVAIGGEAISCVGSFCAVADAGNVVTSTNPTGGANAWTVNQLPANGAASVISCPASTECVAAYARSIVVGTTGSAPATHTLTVTDAGTGRGSAAGSGISCPGTCSRSYAAGTIVSLSATPASGSTFAGWSGACRGIGACHVTMSAERAVTATFNRSGAGPTVPSAAQIKKLLSSEIVPPRSAAKVHQLLSAGRFVETFTALEAGVAVVSWYQLPPGAHLAARARPKAVLVATGRTRLQACRNRPAEDQAHPSRQETPQAR